MAIKTIQNKGLLTEPANDTNAVRTQEPSSPSVDDATALCGRALEGDPEAEAMLIEQTLPKIRQLLTRIVWDKESVDDLLQDTLELAVRKLRTGAIQHPDLFASFVCGIARNVLVSHIRRKQRDAGNLPIDEIVERNHLATDGAMDPLEHLLDEESSDVILTAITKLPRARDRRVLIGYYFVGLSVKSLSRELGLKEAHFYRVLYRARKRLEKLLSELPD